jgi:hypothetical protein
VESAAAVVVAAIGAGVRCSTECYLLGWGCSLPQNRSLVMIGRKRQAAGRGWVGGRLVLVRNGGRPNGQVVWA